MKKIFNRRAKFDYQLLKKLEAGIALTGPEVKSVKAGHLKLAGSFVRISDGQAWLYNVYINPYPFADNRDYNPSRPRKLLLHKKELVSLGQQAREKNLTLVPVSCYTRHGRVKLEIALAKGKKEYEKREVIKKRDIEREIRSTKSEIRNKF